MADLEEDIESLVRRNEVVDEEFQGMKTDITSLSNKILAIKVSFSVFSKIDSISYGPYGFRKQFLTFFYLRKTSMGRPLLAPLAKNTFNLAPGEMERIPFGQMLQGKGINFSMF